MRSAPASARSAWWSASTAKRSATNTAYSSTPATCGAARDALRLTLDWVREVQQRGAGEIVLNCMASDGVRSGYDLRQLAAVRAECRVPLVASGGAGAPAHFVAVFREAGVDAALAASVFHSGEIAIGDLKRRLKTEGIEVRL